jgi:hypothetical protein
MWFCLGRAGGGGGEIVSMYLYFIVCEWPSSKCILPCGLIGVYVLSFNPLTDTYVYMYILLCLIPFNV